MTPQNDIEEEIRRQMLADRARMAPPPPIPAPEAPRPHYAAPQNPSRLERMKSQGGILGALASILLVLAKIGTPILLLLSKLKFLLVGLKLLTFGKILLTGGSMLLSMWVYALRFGWPFGVGIVVLIFIHESGHALAARMRGIATGIMVFIPLFGAFVTTKGYGRKLADDAFIGIMGPIFGTLAGVACLGGYLLTGSEFWLALAQFDFLINLFNLAPTAPLDGGWITPLFSPKILAVGAVLLLFLVPYNPLIAILALMSLPRIIAGWKADPKTQPYYRVAASDRWKFGFAYLGLALFLALSQYSLHVYLHTGRLPLA